VSNLRELLYFAASAGTLCLANLVVFRARRARGALPIALLCVSLFLWDFGQGALLRYKQDYWATIRLIGSAMSPAFLWHFVLVFTGRDRTLRTWLVIVYVAAGLFTVGTAGAFVHPVLKAYVAGSAWNYTYLAVFFPFFLISFRLVSLRRREVQTAVERNAANFVGFGIAVAVVMGFTELVHRPWPWVPALGHVGTVLCTLVLAVAILRHRLLEKQAPIRTLFFFLLLAGSAVVVVALLSSLMQERTRPAFVLGAVALTTLLALYRTVFIRLYEQAERRQRLALIGTMAAGVAHEIRNPLASIKGAAQFVQKDLEGTPGKEDAKEYLKLLVGEVDRLNGVVESFLTYARPIDPRRQDVLLDAFLKDLLRLHAASLPTSIRLETSFDPDLPAVRADPALLTNAVTNAIRNAAEVMPDGGTLTIRTSGLASALRSWAAIEIEDSGPGIPRGDVDRIFQPFYTTKAKGTGLGLAIALRILEAHGGDIAVENLEPRGCRFTFLLPLPIL
jgi:two-component system sensor histidine kinase HydH